jgi:FkbM family methyltransferase
MKRFDPRCPLTDEVDHNCESLHPSGSNELRIRDFFWWPTRKLGFLTPLYIMWRRIYRRFRLHVTRNQTMTIRVFDYKMNVPLHVDGIGDWLAAYGFRELDQRYVLQRIVKQDFTIIDLGANIGYYVAMYGKFMNRRGIVFAVEPDPRNIKYLRRNIALNQMESMVTIERSAISDSNGMMLFHQAVSTNLSGLNLSKLDRPYNGTITVPVIDLAELLDRINKPIDVLRMDIEGHEVQVLSSLSRMSTSGALDERPKFVVFEPHSWEYDPNNDMRAVLQNLFRRGYHTLFLCTASERFSALKPLGYQPTCLIRSFDRAQGVYMNIRDNDASELIGGFPGITTVCLERLG